MNMKDDADYEQMTPEERLAKQREIIEAASRACPVCGLIGGDHDQLGCPRP